MESETAVGRTSDTRERLLDAACSLFHHHGYQSVSVQDLCDAASVKKGSFYHFFRSKQELALAVIDSLHDDTRRDFERARVDAETPIERIQHFFVSAARSLGQRRSAAGSLCGCPFGNLAVEMAAQDPILREKLSGVFDEWAEFFEAALREAGGNAGAAAARPEEVAESLVAYLQGIALMSKTRNCEDIADRLAGRALALLHEAPV